MRRFVLSRYRGHDGADVLIMQNFVQEVANGQVQNGTTSGLESARSHLIVFAAEESRNTGNTIVMDDYVRSLKQNASSVTV
ncbi:hypothetical protein GCM10025859_06800 [Alicyclobacillus fastidiosus]|nr:hypothetical protein GCM10025859_06800 [Alicyclobacillus fastidiosus]